jgi:hypothetical protein
MCRVRGANLFLLRRFDPGHRTRNLTEDFDSSILNPSDLDRRSADSPSPDLGDSGDSGRLGRFGEIGEIRDETTPDYLLSVGP